MSADFSSVLYLKSVLFIYNYCQENTMHSVETHLNELRRATAEK